MKRAGWLGLAWVDRWIDNAAVRIDGWEGLWVDGGMGRNRISQIEAQSKQMMG